MQRGNQARRGVALAVLLVMVSVLAGGCSWWGPDEMREIPLDDRGYSQVEIIQTWQGGRLQDPGGVAVNSRGELFISDREAHVIWVYDQEGECQAVLGEEGRGPGQFRRPGQVVLGPRGLLYVADVGNNRVQVLEQDGTFVSQVGNRQEFSDFFCPEEHYREPLGGLAVDDDGNILVTLSGYGYDDSDNALRVYTPEGRKRHDFRSRLTGEVELVPFTRPADVALGPGGRIHLVHGAQGLGKVLRIPLDNGQVHPEDVEDFGTLGKNPGEFMHRPLGILVDRYGHIFVADTYNQRVQVLDTEGEWMAAFDLRHLEDQVLQAPSGLAQDQEGYLYVVDQGGGRVLKVESPLPGHCREELPENGL